MNRPDIRTPRARSRQSEEALAAGADQVRLGDLLRLRKDIIHPRNRPKGRLPFVGLEHVESHTGNRIGLAELELSELTGRKPQFRSGDIVYGYLRPYLNKVWLADFDGLCSVDQYVFEIDRDRVEPEFIAWFMRSPAYLRQAPTQKNPGQLPRIRTEEVASVSLPLPSLSVQRRIAERLREQMAEVARARAAVQAQLAAAQALPAAVLRAHFTTPAAQRWPRRRLGEICALLPARSVASDGNTEVRTTTSACLTETGFSPAGIKVARMDADDAKESQLTPGEILIARSNTPELVGRVAMFEGPADGVVASDLTIRLRPTDDSRGQFLTRYLSFLYTEGYWQERASGASGTMKKITRAQLDALEVPFPPLPEQRTLAARLTAEMSTATALRASLQARLAEIERLPAALLRTAFSPAN